MTNMFTSRPLHFLFPLLGRLFLQVSCVAHPHCLLTKEWWLAAKSGGGDGSMTDLVRRLWCFSLRPCWMSVVCVLYSNLHASVSWELRDGLIMPTSKGQKGLQGYSHTWGQVSFSNLLSVDTGEIFNFSFHRATYYKPVVRQFPFLTNLMFLIVFYSELKR